MMTPAEHIELRIRAAQVAELILSIRPDRPRPGRWTFSEAVQEMKEIDKLLRKLESLDEGEDPE